MSESALDERGYLCFSWESVYIIVVNANYIVLDFLATLPQYQRRGAASVLLRWRMEQAAERGVGIFLEATMDGYQLYRKRGWKDVHELTMNYDTCGGKGAQTLMLMRKAAP